MTLKCSQGCSSDIHIALLGEQYHTAGKDTALSGAELPGFKSGLCSSLAVRPGQVGLSLYASGGQIIESPPHNMMMVRVSSCKLSWAELKGHHQYYYFMSVCLFVLLEEYG